MFLKWLLEGQQATVLCKQKSEQSRDCLAS
jgi:hypothetical protein